MILNWDRKTFIPDDVVAILMLSSWREAWPDADVLCSEYANEGIWGRWLNYAKNGHGGNKLLKPRDPNDFQWSIVRTVSRLMSERDVTIIEGSEKIKHGCHVHGLNDN